MFQLYKFTKTFYQDKLHIILNQDDSQSKRLSIVILQSLHITAIIQRTLAMGKMVYINEQNLININWTMPCSTKLLINIKITYHYAISININS